MIRYLALLVTLHFGGSIAAQNYISIAPWDNALSYHPSIVGIQADESIQMNIFSQKGSNGVNPISLSNRLTDFVDFSGTLREPEDVKNSYFLGYQKTAELKGGHRITGGLQLQHYKELERLSQDFTSAGFTINYHKPLAKKQGVTKYFSMGYQINLLLQTPNVSVTSFSHREFVDASLLSFEDYNTQFRSTGINQSISINYSYLSNRQTLFSTGLTFSFFSFRVASGGNITNSGIFRFQSTSIRRANIVTELQQMIGNKFVLQVNYLEHIIGRQLGLGLGFRLKRRSILKFHFLIGNTPNPDFQDRASGFTHAQISLDMKRYKYIATLGIDNISFLKLGVVFRLTRRDLRSMLSVSQ